MNQPYLVIAFLAATTAALGAQQASQSNPYAGTSNPPPDDTIETSTTPPAKPPAGHPADAQQAVPVQHEHTQQPTAGNPAEANPLPAGNANVAPAMGDGTDDGIVEVAPPSPRSVRPALSDRPYVPDPDGDIVHPAPLGPGEIGEGTAIRVRLLDDLSSSLTEQGQPFRSRVASDVVEGGQVVIPAGSEIDGKVVDVSGGHFGGQGTMLLRPEKVILPDGASYRLHAMVSSTPGSHTNVEAEGVIRPGSTLKHDSIEYGGVVGGGAVAGAFLGGPVGALAGGIIGAGLVTTHLLVSHPQVHLDSGSVLILTLTERMHLEPAGAKGE